MTKNFDERIIDKGFHTGHKVDYVTIPEHDYEYLKYKARLADDYETNNKELHRRGKKVRQQNKRYREALEFYAEPKNWLPQNEDVLSLITMDYGEKARKALEEGTDD